MFERCAHILRLGPHDQDWIVHLKKSIMNMCFLLCHVSTCLGGYLGMFWSRSQTWSDLSDSFPCEAVPLKTPNVCWSNNKKHPNYSTVTYLLFKNQMKVMVRCASWSLDGVPPTSFTHRCSHLWRFGWTLKDWVFCFLLMCHVCIDGYFFTRKKFHLSLILWDTETHCPKLLIRFLRNHQIHSGQIIATSSRLLVTPTGPT